MTFDQALDKLKAEKILWSDMLEPLSINFEFFLRLGQLKKEEEAAVIDRLIAHLEYKRSKNEQKK